MFPFPQIWGAVEQGDIGCSRGGGRDAKEVFSEAGLLYASSAGFQTTTRQGTYENGAAAAHSANEMNLSHPLI